MLLLRGRVEKAEKKQQKQSEKIEIKHQECVREKDIDQNKKDKEIEKVEEACSIMLISTITNLLLSFVKMFSSPLISHVYSKLTLFPLPYHISSSSTNPCEKLA